MRISINELEKSNRIVLSKATSCVCVYTAGRKINKHVIYRRYRTVGKFFFKINERKTTLKEEKEEEERGF